MKISSRTIKEIAILGIVSFFACAGFLLFSLKVQGLGFPLDDAWIHQTFARNFAEDFSWSFQMGRPSGGSTGPLWGLLLSLIHFLKLPVILGTHVMGFLLLWACSAVCYSIGRSLFPDRRRIALVLGAAIALEWHLVWSALSGMETLLLLSIVLLVFKWMLERRNDWWVPGILTGIAVWVRPDGITLLGPLIASLVFRDESASKKITSGLICLGAVILAAAPYFLFNYLNAGDFWPNTFYAKQAEYAALRQQGIIARVLSLAKQAVTGIGIVLLPGLLGELLDIYRERDWERAGIFLWAAGYLGIYAVRLPVVYQHGRYIMPVLPSLLILGVAGFFRWADFRSKESWKRILSGVWTGTAALVLAAFWLLGARAYALDVGVIETEMVQTARWIEENTPGNAIIGAHDIGGLGYFGDREVIDLAGLITPDVIPFIRDQEKLAEYLDEKGADYLMTFPSWYPELVDGLPLIYQGEGQVSAMFGMDSMAVFLWK